MSELFLPAGLSRQTRTRVLEEAYKGGYTGCFLKSHGGEHGQAARDASDKFKEMVGAANYKFTSQSARHRAAAVQPRNGIDGCYIFTSYGFEEFAKYNEGYVDWLYGMFQDSGCCVGASGTEMIQDLLGKLSKDLTKNYRMVCLAAMWTYLYRNHCGGGWYMGAHATEAIEHGWCPATIFDGRKLGDLTVPNYKSLKFDGEDDSERLTTRSWCRGRPPAEIANWVKANFMFEPGAITELDDASPETLRSIAQMMGDLHHGSNQTAGSGGLNRIVSIGGHAQTDYGSDWSDQCLEFFKGRGVSCSKDNFIKLQGQTWGDGWSGEISDDNWPYGTNSKGQVVTWAEVVAARNSREKLQDLVADVQNAAGWGWGPKPEGSWLVTVSTFQRYFADETYVYLPNLKGVPKGNVPPPPPPPPAQWPVFTGDMLVDITPDGRKAVRGVQVLKMPDGKEYPYLVEPVPELPGRYHLTPKVL